MIRVKLLNTKHRSIEQANKYMDIYSCVYKADEETIEQLVEKAVIRDQIIKIEVKKWFEPLNNTNELTIKEERKNEVFSYLDKLPNDCIL